jgi:hypothetical protein
MKSRCRDPKVVRPLPPGMRLSSRVAGVAHQSSWRCESSCELIETKSLISLEGVEMKSVGLQGDAIYQHVHPQEAKTYVY